MLFLSLAFWAGRNTIALDTKQQVATSQDTVAGMVQVSQDMVNWLETARFFTRMGMEQRANNAFAQDGELVHSDSPETQTADMHLTEPLQSNSLAELLARCDQEQAHVDSCSTDTPLNLNKRHYSLIAIGGLYHD
jgi:hypothetical protein